MKPRSRATALHRRIITFVDEQEHYTFAAAVHERSLDDGCSIERLDTGISLVRTDGSVIDVSCDDRLAPSAGLTDHALAWLRDCVDGHQDTALVDGMRSIERRTVVLRDGIEHRTHSRLRVIRGIGIVDDEPSNESPNDPGNAQLDPSLPLLFAAGSAATLMHELAGHRAESSRPPLEWPRWIAITDDPARYPWGASSVDDSGSPLKRTDLTRAPAQSLRRWRAVDLPQPRMTSVVVERVIGSPWRLPRTHVRIARISAGHYDDRDDSVILRIASAALADGESLITIATPAVVRFDCRTLVARLAGAYGDPVMAPGVICGSHGSEIPVASIACDVLFDPA